MPDSVLAPSLSRTRHARFYLLRGTDIFSVGKTLYKLHTDLLGLKGGVIQDLLDLPQNAQDREGRTDDRPIVLPQLTEREFEHYLEFVYDGHLVPPYPLQKLVDVLKVSTQWDVDNGRMWAIHHLEREYVPPSLRLHLGLRYDIPRWVEPAFRDLVTIVPIEDLRREDFSSIKYPIFALIVKVKEAIERERRILAHRPPDIVNHDLSCIDTTRCAMIWREVWWMKIGRRLLDPDPEKELRFNAGREAVKTVEWAGMTPACRNMMVRQVCEGKGFDGDEEILSAGLLLLSEANAECFAD